MKNVILVVLAVLIVPLLTGCLRRRVVVVDRSVPVVVEKAEVVPSSPAPAEKVEIIGVAPYAGAMWVKGHWVWRRRGWIWIAGHWS